MNTLTTHRFYHNRPVLVAGGCGFIGSNLTLRLVDLGARVTVVDNLFPGLGGNKFNLRSVKNKINFLSVSIANSQKLKSLLPKQELIFNLAGTHSHIDSMRDPVGDLRLTCENQLMFLESCRKANPKIKILMAGTRNQYGKPAYLPVDENHPLAPLDVNGANWLAVENYHFLYHRIYGLKTCSLRLSNTYGPRHQMHHPYQGILNWFIKVAIMGKPITLFGGGKQKRDAVFVDDVAEAFLLAGASSRVWGNVYNLGYQAVSLRDFAKTIISILGKGKIINRPFPQTYRQIEPGDFEMNWQKINKELGWRPKTDLSSGIKTTLDYYQLYRQHYW